MHPYEHRKSGLKPKAKIRRTKEQSAAEFELALVWRRQWRAELTARQAEADNPRRKKPDQNSARFAAGITRAEFGRFYWDPRRKLSANGQSKKAGRPKKEQRPNKQNKR